MRKLFILTSLTFALVTGATATVVVMTLYDEVPMADAQSN